MRSIVRRNLIWLGSTTAGSMVASLIYGILVARYLGAVDFGRFALVVGVGGLLTSMAQGGGSTALVVMAAQEPQNAGRLVWPGVIIQGAVGVVAALFAIPIIWALSRDDALVGAAATYGIANLGLLLTTVPVSIYRGLDRMEWGVALTGAAACTVALTLGVVALRLGLVAIIAANAVAQVVVLAFVLPWSVKDLSSTGWTPAILPRLWSASVALWGVNLAQAVHWRVGLLTVQSFSGSYEVGLYSAAAKLVENLRAIPWFLLMAVLPAFVQMGQSDRSRLKDLVQQALRYALLLAFPLSAVLTILSSFVVRTLYTSEYAASVGVMRICSLALLPLFVHWVFLNSLVSLRMERQLIYAYLLSIVVEVGLNGFLVPHWGASGAAIGYVIGESTVALACGVYVARSVGRLRVARLARMLVPGLACLLLAAITPVGVPPMAWVAVVLGVYVAGVSFLGIVTFSELRDLVS